jgi:RNA polymerase sigma factor (sigma-70 family)
MDLASFDDQGYCSYVDEPLDNWFKREILAHEQTLVRYLLRVWPRRDDVSDLRQETYARVYAAARTARPQSPRAFLLGTAHNLLLDRIRRERVVSIEAVADIDKLNVLVDEVSPEQRAMAHQQIKLLARAFELLPAKCREVVWLRRVEEIPQKEVAKMLGIGERTVEKHVSKGACLLAEYMLAGRVTTERSEHERSPSEDECEQGKRRSD